MSEKTIDSKELRKEAYKKLGEMLLIPGAELKFISLNEPINLPTIPDWLNLFSKDQTPWIEMDCASLGISPAQEAMNACTLTSEMTKKLLFDLQKETDKDKKVVKLSDYRF